MPTNLSEPEILEFFRAVESGETVLIPLEDPQGVYTGAVVYFASNQWSITISIEDNSWQHVERLSSSDGRASTRQAIREWHSTTEIYRPSETVAWIRYYLPGWGCYQCVECGQDLSADQWTPQLDFSRTKCGPFCSTDW